MIGPDYTTPLSSYLLPKRNDGSTRFDDKQNYLWLQRKSQSNSHFSLRAIMSLFPFPTCVTFNWCDGWMIVRRPYNHTFWVISASFDRMDLHHNFTVLEVYFDKWSDIMLIMSLF